MTQSTKRLLISIKGLLTRLRTAPSTPPSVLLCVIPAYDLICDAQKVLRETKPPLGSGPNKRAPSSAKRRSPTRSSRSSA